MKLPNKKTWAENFIKSEKYVNILRCINNIPDPDFSPVWNISKLNNNIPLRHHFYLRKVVPLTSFYFIDFISVATDGGIITNICDGNNYFVGMFNIRNGDGSNNFANIKPIKLDKLMIFKKGISFDNAISICENVACNFELLEKYIDQFIRCIRYSKDQGYGYISFNSFLLMSQTSHEFIVKNDLNKFYRLNMFVDSIIDSFANKVEIIEYENDIVENEEDGNPVDGDIRFLFKVKPSVEV